jgi:hypothetical protein
MAFSTAFLTASILQGLVVPTATLNIRLPFWLVVERTVLSVSSASDDAASLLDSSLVPFSGLTTPMGALFELGILIYTASDIQEQKSTMTRCLERVAQTILFGHSCRRHSRATGDYPRLPEHDVTLSNI